MHKGVLEKNPFFGSMVISILKLHLSQRRIKMGWGRGEQVPITTKLRIEGQQAKLGQKKGETRKRKGKK